MNHQWTELAGNTIWGKLLDSHNFKQAKESLAAVILDASKQIHGVRAPADEKAKLSYSVLLKEFQRKRGRDLFYPLMSSGFGNGPLLELLDGSVKFDMITGIGVSFFGHNNPELIDAHLSSSASDIMQGNLQPGLEAYGLLNKLLENVGAKSRLTHGWFMCSGTMVNEVALKIIRQKHAPKSRIFAFEDCFAGRSTAMQEITDSPGYRVGQPVYGEVTHLPFFDENLSLDQNIDRVTKLMTAWTTRYPNYCAIMAELIQGEGGFRTAPSAFFRAVFTHAKSLGLAVWVDEIQTFGRTGELFAYQTLDLADLVDVVTLAKLLQAAAVLYTAEYNPKPGLVSGTFAGSSGNLAAASRSLEILTRGDMLGAKGHIQKCSREFSLRLEAIQKKNPKMIGKLRITGGMIAFQPFDGSLATTKNLLTRLFDNGVIAFFCGHDPYFVRMLPPLASMSVGHIEEVCAIIEKSLAEFSSSMG